MRTPGKVLITAATATVTIVLVLATGLWRAPAGPATGGPAIEASPTPTAAPSPAAVAATPARTGAQVGQARLAAAVPVHRPVGGRVIGADGRPAAGAEVVLHRVLRSWPELRTEPIEQCHTSVLGAFTFRTDRGPDLMLEARAAGQASGLVEAPPQLARVTLVLMHAYTVQGYVFDIAGTPMAGCEVVLEPTVRTDRMPERTRTDASGRFVFANTAPGVVRVSARCEAFQPATLSEVTIGGEDALRLQFREPALRLQGTVVTEAAPQRPIAGAVVRAYASAWNGVPLETRTDGEGHFHVEGLGDGNWRLEVTHEAHSTASRLVTLSRPAASAPALTSTSTSSSASASTATAVPDLRIELARKSRVRGVLLGDLVTAGVDLCLWTANGETGRATTDAAGRFEFPQPFSLGPATLEITSGEVCFRASSGRELELEVEAGGSSVQPETVVQPEVVRASLLRGRIVDAAGAPIEGVLVRSPRVRRGPFKLPRLLAVSSTDGWFGIHGLSGETTLWFEHDDYAVHETAASAPPPGETTTMPPVVLVKRGGIAGTVVRDGKPLAGAVVMATGSGRLWYYEYTGPDGGYAIRELPPGSYRLRVSYSSLSVARAADQEPVVVHAGATTGPIDVTLPPGRTLTGRVTDPRGEPLGGVMVRLDGDVGSSTQSDPKGRFTLDVPHGPVELLAFAPELLVSSSTRVAADANEAHVQLPVVPHGTVSGSVRGLPGNKLVTRAILRVLPLSGAVLRAPVDPDDPDDPAGALTIAATGDGDRAAGTLHPSTGEHAAAAAPEAAAQRAQRHVRARLLSMPGGELHIERFPAGTSLLVLQASGYAPFVQEVRLGEGQEVKLGTVRLEPGATLRGVVLDEGGDPIAGAGVHVGIEHDLYVNGGETTIATDLRGRFEVRGVSRHSDSLVVVAPGYARQTVRLQLPEDLLRAEPLPVRMRRGSDIRVEVADRDGKPARQCVLLLFQDGTIVEHCYPSEPGVGVFRRRAPGRYVVRVFGDEAEARVQVTEDGRVYRASLRTR